MQGHSPRALLLGGVLGTHVDRREGTAGPGDELLDPELRVRQERARTALQGDAALVQGDRALERLAPGLELADGSLELGQRLVEGERCDRPRRVPRSVRWSSA